MKGDFRQEASKDQRWCEVFPDAPWEPNLSTHQGMGHEHEGCLEMARRCFTIHQSHHSSGWEEAGHLVEYTMVFLRGLKAQASGKPKQSSHWAQGRKVSTQPSDTTDFTTFFRRLFNLMWTLSFAMYSFSPLHPSDHSSLQAKHKHMLSLWDLGATDSHWDPLLLPSEGAYSISVTFMLTSNNREAISGHFSNNKTLWMAMGSLLLGTDRFWLGDEGIIEMLLLWCLHDITPSRLAGRQRAFDSAEGGTLAHGQRRLQAAHTFSNSPSHSWRVI